MPSQFGSPTLRHEGVGGKGLAFHGWGLTALQVRPELASCHGVGLDVARPSATAVGEVYVLCASSSRKPPRAVKQLVARSGGGSSLLPSFLPSSGGKLLAREPPKQNRSWSSRGARSHRRCAAAAVCERQKGSARHGRNDIKQDGRFNFTWHARPDSTTHWEKQL